MSSTKDEISTDEESSCDMALRSLSSVAKMYDIDGDGQLDEAELAMRQMDKSHRGYLTNEKVYDLMKDHLATQNKLFKTKKIALGLAGLVVLLAISNLGTSLASAYLAKDTQINFESELTNKRTQEIVSTQSAWDNLEVQRVTNVINGRRKLCDKSRLDEGGKEFNCEMESFLFPDDTVLFLDEKSCNKALKKCKKGESVNLIRTLSTGIQDSYDICPYTSGQISRHLRSTLTRNDISITIEPVGDGCEVGGLVRSEGEYCDVTSDCASDLQCTRDDAIVDDCQRHCANLRWAPRRIAPCQRECEQATCKSVAKSGSSQETEDRQRGLARS